MTYKVEIEGIKWDATKKEKIEKPSKITKEIARPFKCVLCGEMVNRLDGGVCTLCFNEKLAKDRVVR